MATIKLKIKTIPVSIDTEWIRLDALLKLAGAVETGGQAKFEIQAGSVELDGAVCTMRGKKVRPGQRVRFGGKTYEIVPCVSPFDPLPQAAEQIPAGGKTAAAEKAGALPHSGVLDCALPASPHGAHNPHNARWQDMGDAEMHSAPSDLSAPAMDHMLNPTNETPSKRGEKESRPAKSPYSRKLAKEERKNPPGGGKNR